MSKSIAEELSEGPAPLATTALAPPSPTEMLERAQLRDVVMVLSVTPAGQWSLVELDRELIESTDVADQKAAALAWVWDHQRSIGWAREGGRRVE